MFWMFLINTNGILMMWVAFWFLLIITQKGGKTSDKSQSFQLWFFCSCCKLGNPGSRMIVRFQSREIRANELLFALVYLVRCTPGRKKVADFCDCSLSPAAQPGTCCCTACPASPVSEQLFGIGPGSVSDIGLRSRSRSSSVLHSLLHQSSFFANIGRNSTNLN